MGTVGLLDERPALDTQISLRNALKFWSGVDGCADASACLAALSLNALMDVPVRYLSTGQKKRAAFARLLGQSAPVWLLDEPLNGLDDTAQRQVEALIAQHCSDGGLCIVASHQAIALPNAQTLALKDYAS